MSNPQMDDLLIPARDDDRVRKVGREFIEVGFRTCTSLFDPGRALWNRQTVDELYECYNLRLDEGTDKFHEKLKRQLADASDDAKLLMAELLALQSLPLTKSNLRPSSKVERVERVLQWMDKPVALPRRVVAAFQQGSWNGGTGAHTLLWKWLFDAIELLRQWLQVNQRERLRLTRDAWDWRTWVRSTGAMPSLTEALIYLGFPEKFLPIINIEHKSKIRSAFQNLLPNARPTGDLDSDLRTITLELQRQYRGRVDYYQPPFRDEWRSALRPSDERRAWFVRLPSGRSSALHSWTTGGVVTFTNSRLGTLPRQAERTTIRATVEAAYGHLEYPERAALTTQIYSFWTLMNPDDLVVTVLDDQLWAGLLKNGSQNGATSGEELSHEVDWFIERPLALSALPQSLREELQGSDRIIDISGEYSGLSQLLGLEGDSDGESHDRPQVADPLDPTRLERLSDRTNLDVAWLQDLVSLLLNRRQLVLYGPPGTGKTYLAQELATHLTGTDAVRLVQFHPSYAYEDFVEGFRPTRAKDGSVGFDLTAGPLRDLVSKAHNDARPHVLIIDEMNRANLAKVFGELYFLLEYRDRSVRLQYSPGESFSLPKNFFVIGTMNTADRSIAQLDAAIRRRFAFEEMHPDVPPVSGLLTRWLGPDGADDPRPALLRALNDTIPESDRDCKIGPSYLMREEARTGDGLARIWRHDLLPLLVEHFHGRFSHAVVHEQFGLEAIRSKAGIADLSSEERPSS